MKKVTQLFFLLFAFQLAGFAQVRKQTDIRQINKKMFDAFLSKANSGDPKAMYQVASFYEVGTATEKNLEEAIKWYTKSAEDGYAHAWYKIGMFYKYGKGLTTDFEKAFYCFSKGADANDPLSIYSLGYMQYKGIGGRQSYRTAFALFERAANLKIHDAMYFLGLCHKNGYGTKINKELSKRWLNEAVRNGNKQAIQELASPESEVNAKESQIIVRLDEIQKINHKNNGSPLKFQAIKHDPVSIQGVFSGEFTGYLIKYDWSGEHILDVSTVQVLVKQEKNGITMEWREEDEDPVKTTAKYTNEGLKLEKFKYKKRDHYNRIPASISFSKLAMKTFQDNKNLYVTANITTNADEKKEPGNPEKIVLIKPLGKVALSSQSPATSKQTEEAQVSLNAFPNPVANQVTIVFRLPNGCTVIPLLFDMTGKQLFKGTGQYFGKGTATLSIPVRQPPGQYIVKLQCGGSESQTVKIIKY